MRCSPPHIFIFDWDGTLSDSVGRIVICLRRAALDLGLEDLGDDAFSEVIGLGLPQAIAQLYPGLDADTGERFRVGYAGHFIAEDIAPSKLFPKALEVLEELRARGHYIAVATGKSRRGLDRVLASMGMEGFFHATRCADETASKPDPRMILEIIEELGEAVEQAVVMGDTEYDMDMARRAGVAGIGVSYGVHSPQRLALYRPSLIVGCLSELLDWVPGSSGEYVDADLCEKAGEADQR